MKKRMWVCEECLFPNSELLSTTGGYFYYFRKDYFVPYSRRESSSRGQCEYCSNYTSFRYTKIPPEGKEGLYITDKNWQPPLPGMEFVGSYKVE